jgi:TPR repeat protein
MILMLAAWISCREVMRWRENAAVAVLILAVGIAGSAAAGPYEDGMAAYKRGDYVAAMRHLRPLAEQGDATLQAALGAIYANGWGVPQNYAAAASWYQKAADQGYADAQSMLGLMYQTGQGVSQDYQAALNWFRKAAALGHADAQRLLGAAYYKGQGVAQDYAAAVSWFRKAADQGNVEAQSVLGSMYFLGQGVPQDYVSAHRWLNLAAARGAKGLVEIRDMVAAKMTPAQIVEAQRLAREWMPKSTPR